MASAARKGYEWDEANEIAIRIFNEAEERKNGMPIEWYIGFVADKNEK